MKPPRFPSCAARLAIIASLAASPSLHADDVADAAAHSIRANEDVAKHAGKIRDDLAQIRAEAELNQLDQPAAAPITTFSDTLGQTRETHLVPIAAELKAATDASTDATRRDALVAAYAWQKALELALKDSSAQFSPAEAQTRLLRHIAALLARQMTNVRQTTTLATLADDPATLAGSDRRRYSVDGIEQAALEQELAIIARSVAITPPDWPDQTSATPATPAVNKALRVTSTASIAQAATAATRAGPLLNAVSCQKDVERNLSQLLDEVLLVEPNNLIGKDAKKLLKQLLADERTLRVDTDGKKTDQLTLAERQDRIEDRTAVLQRLLACISPEAADRVGKACKKMKEASTSLKPGSNPGGAVPAEDGAIALLEEALKKCPKSGSGSGSGSGGDGEGEGEGDGEGSGGQGQGDNRGNESDKTSDDQDEKDGGTGGVPKEKDSPNMIPPKDTLPPVTAMVLGQLVKKEREALSPNEVDKTPPEYAPLVEQYLRSLSAPAPQP